MEQTKQILIVDFDTNKAILEVDINPKLTLLQARPEIQEQGDFQNFIFVNKDGVKRGEKIKTIENSLTDGNLLFIRFEKTQSQSKVSSKVVKNNDQSYYRCEKGHDLFYLDQQDLYAVYGAGCYSIMQKTFCSVCNHKNICRTICPQCSTKGNVLVFCAECRQTPCTKSTCLYEHKLIKATNMSETLFCDYCGNLAKNRSPTIYKDSNCNFDICQVCYEKLPETHELVPFKMSKNAIQHLTLH